MKYTLLVITLIFTPLALFARSVSIQNHQWELNEVTGDSGTLKVVNNSLQLQFKAKVQKEYQFGHHRVKQAVYEIYLKEPIKLNQQEKRIVYTATGIKQMYRRSADSFNLFPVIRDANGEVFTYTSYPEPYLGQPAKWNLYPHHIQTWRSNYFYTNEAGGTTTDIFTAEGGDRNNWPDGDLEFLGFKLIPRSKKDGRELSGSVFISNLYFGQKIVEEKAPYLFVGNDLKDKGDYLFSYEVRNEFQGTPLAEGAKKFSFDPADKFSAIQKFHVPLGKNDNYWIRYAITDMQGKFIASKSTRWQVEKDLGFKFSAINLNQAPKVGYIRVNPEKNTTGVYEQGKSFDVNLRVFSKLKKGDFTLSWKLLAYNRGMDGKNYDTLLQEGNRTFSLAENTLTNQRINLKKVKGRDAYRLKLFLKNKNSLIDEYEYVLGCKTDFSKPYTARIGHKLNRHEIKKNTYYQTTFHHPSYSLPTSLEEDLKGFEIYLRESRQMSPNTNIMLDIRDLEILPGVFNFYILDQYLNLIADYGMKATVSFRHYDDNGEYLWQKYTRQRSFDNIEINQHYYGSFDFSDTRTSDDWKEAAKKVWLRYKKHPAFIGYYFYSVAGELLVIDKPWHGINVGHNSVSRTAFQNYLKDEVKLSLTDLNKRWTTNFKNWQDINTPLPSYELGAKPDLSMQWIDFCKFKRFQDLRYWYEMIVKHVREYDDDHVIVCHNGQTVPVKNFGLQDYSHNGGNHWKVNEKALQAAWEKGTGQITEPHNPHHWGTYGDPEERGWVLDHSVYAMLAQGGGGCANLGTYWLNRPEHLIDHYGFFFSYDRVEKYKPILNELVQTRLLADAPKIGTIQDFYTLFAKHRTIFYHRTWDLKRWLELLKADGLNSGELTLPNGEWSPDINEFKLIVPNAIDEVMSIKNINKLNELVRNGAKMVMTANTGRYCPEEKEQEFILLQKLGINPPKGKYNLKGLNVTAEVTAENSIFARGEKFAFYTVEQQTKESQGDEVKDTKSFQSWPYRWLPMSNYFGYFSENKNTNGEVIARFNNGAVAMSTHKVGKGEVLVLWGTPDYKPELYKGFMKKVAKWANALEAKDANPMPYMFELSPMDGRERHYAVIYEKNAGKYTQRIPNAPDGVYFVDDMVTDYRFGTYTGKELREIGLEIEIDDHKSPLRIIRAIAIDKKQQRALWVPKYRQIGDK